MSLIQIWIEPNRARVAADTAAHHIGPQSSPIQVSKILLLAHAQTVLAFRGNSLAAFQVFAQAFLTPGSGDFDEILQSMRRRVADAATHWPDGDPNAGPSLFELHVIGYSALAQKFAASSFTIDLAESGNLSERPVNGQCRVAPGVTPIPPLDNDAAMLEVAAGQIEWIKTNAPCEAAGGRLIVAELTAGEVRIRDAGEIIAKT